MYRIKLADPPKITSISPKYYSAVDLVSTHLDSISKSLNCVVSSVYVRGSVVHSSLNQFSDLDLVVVINETSLQKLLEIENVIEALLAMYRFSFSVDVKVYSLDAKGGIEPAISNKGLIRERVKKHINFDLYANGVFLFGRRVKNGSAIFSSFKNL